MQGENFWEIGYIYYDLVKDLYKPFRRIFIKAIYPKMKLFFGFFQIVFLIQTGSNVFVYTRCDNIVRGQQN